jgi:lipoprotein-anchoring transpeptidase ErfK/SrfK
MWKWLVMTGMVVTTAIGSVAFIATRPLEEIAVESWEEADVRLRVDLSDRRLYVEEYGSVIQSYDVAVGKKDHPTPRGAYAVRRVIWNPRWVPPQSDWAKGKKPREAGDPRNPMGRAKIFFREPTYYLHGTDDEASIGKAASHGCVRMRNDDIIELSRLLVERGGAPIDPGAIQRIISRVRQSHEVRLSRPIPLRIEA